MSKFGGSLVCFIPLCRFLNLPITVEAICSKGLRATFLSTYNEVLAGQNA